MKKTLFFIALIFSVVQIYSVDSDPLLVVTIMVKNEEQVIAETLRPFLEAGVTSYLVFDTGSTDNTVEVTRTLFEQYEVTQGHIKQEAFVNFAVSRNRAIELTEELFPEAEFIFMIDAEWYTKNVKGLLEFCTQNRTNPILSYLIKMSQGNDNFVSYQQRLFKAHEGIRFEGAVHECLNTAITCKLPDDIFFVWDPREQGIIKSQQRWLRDKDLLLQEQEKSPRNPRTLFYLAQTYECLGSLEEARYWYAKRCEVQAWGEEDYMAHYRLAQMYEYLDNWDKALAYYIKAYSLRPTRVEPLVKLAEHYRSVGDFATGFLFAMRACMLPYPQEDTLFIDKVFYDYVRYDLLGIHAWYVQEYEIGKKAVQKALLVQPDAPHLQQNLQLYLEKLP
ncbi:MAG: hypothetical protein CL947_00255 [Epsilonproteobacteria bacterium]|nr:hypothetical protein [Campylobacterota bacterium]